MILTFTKFTNFALHVLFYSFLSSSPPNFYLLFLPISLVFSFVSPSLITSTSSLLFFLSSEACFHYGAQVGLDLEIPLPQPQECWDYSHRLTWLSKKLYFVFFSFSRFLKLHFIYFSMCVWKSENEFQETVLFFCHWVPWIKLRCLSWQQAPFPATPSCGHIFSFPFFLC